MTRRAEMMPALVRMARVRAVSASSMLVVAIATASCSKSSTDKAVPAASASAAVVAAASASAAPLASNAAANAPGAPTAWTGSYVAKVGPVAPPENAKEKAWTDDPGTAAVGKGAIALSVAGARGDTHGELTGPLGDLQVSGIFDGKELRANLLPKDPKADTAMTGFMVLAADGTAPAALKGTLRVSNHDARIVREASVELAKK